MKGGLKMKKLFVGILMVVMLVGVGGVASASDIDVQMSNWSLNTNYDGKGKHAIMADFIISNNTNKNLHWCKISIILLKNGKMVGSLSRPVQDVPSNGFVSKDYWFPGISSFTHFRWSATQIEFK